MKTKDYRYMSLMILICVVGLLAFLAYSYTQRERVSEEQVQLTDFTQDPIIGFAFESRGKNITFEKNNGLWQNTAYPTLSYNQEAIGKSIQLLSELYGTQAIYNPKTLSEYGIDENSAVLDIQLASGKTKQLVIGNKRNDERSYYVFDEQEDIIGKVDESILQPFFYTSVQWIDQTLAFPEGKMLNHFVVTKGNDLFIGCKKEGDKWFMNAPFGYYGIDETVFLKDYETLFSALKKEAFVDVLTNNLKRYGLDTPLFTIYLNDMKYLSFGKVAKDKVYFTYKEEPYVYQMPLIQLDSIIENNLENWLDGYIYQPQKEALKQIEILTKDQNTLLDEEMLENEALIEAITGLTFQKKVIDGTIEQNNPRDAEVTIRYTHQDGKEVVVEFIPYDPSFYLLRKDGVVAFGADKKQIVQLLQLVETMKKE